MCLLPRLNGEPPSLAQGGLPSPGPPHSAAGPRLALHHRLVPAAQPSSPGTQPPLSDNKATGNQDLTAAPTKPLVRRQFGARTPHKRPSIPSPVGKSLQAQVTFLLLPQLTGHTQAFSTLTPRGHCRQEKPAHELTDQGRWSQGSYGHPCAGKLRPREVRPSQQGHTAGILAASTAGSQINRRGWGWESPCPLAPEQVLL